jgi:tRNA A37 methylthiotransferase MiaB
MLPDEAVEQLSGFDVLFFSIYIWNHALSREIARRFRESNPNSVIVFGGPQIPENKQRLECFMEEHPFVDLVCYTEGEEPFLKVLENFETRTWSEVPGIAYRTENGLHVTYPPACINDLNMIPSPYLSGVFDMLMAQNPQVNWSALMETNRGCPFSCAFCYWGASTRRRIRNYSLDRVFAEIEWFAHHEIEFLFCCDANFGILPRDIEIVDRVSELNARNGYPRVFSVQNTKNSTRKIFELQKRLNDAGLQKGVNLAIQSLHRPTLDAIKRSNITTETYSELLTLFNGAGIPAFSDLIIGLPEESYVSYTWGVEQVVRQGQHNRIQFINLTVLENTAMADACYIDRYGLHMVDSMIVSHHSSLTGQSSIKESQHLVIGTAAMPPRDWARARVFSWFMALFYFDRLLQIPMIILDRLAGVGVREVAEHFLNHGDTLPVIAHLLAFMRENAVGIQSGNPEYVPSSEYLNIWWPLDEFLLIYLMRENKLDYFYAETKLLLEPFVHSLPDGLLDESLRLNRALIKEPFHTSDAKIELSYKVPELYESFKGGKEMHPEQGSYRYMIDRTTQRWGDWDVWMREMVWYGGKKGDYLYPCRLVDSGASYREV